MYKIGIIGIGFVGNAMKKSFEEKKINIVCYDKFKASQKFEELIECECIFLALPTPFSEKINQFDKSAIFEVCERLNSFEYKGNIVIKSTIETGTTNMLASKYPEINFLKNPEFLTARTAYDDFHNQKHIVIGLSNYCIEKKTMILVNFYHENYPDSEISIVSSDESETMKLAANSFYAVKIQYFNEIYDYCNKLNIDYNNVKNLMLKN